MQLLEHWLKHNLSFDGVVWLKCSFISAAISNYRGEASEIDEILVFSRYFEDCSVDVSQPNA